jgi:hypothetical protein
MNRLQQQPISQVKVNFLGLQIADLFELKRRILFFVPLLTQKIAKNIPRIWRKGKA